MPFTPRTKKYTDYLYLETNPASEDAVRAQMDGVVDEVFETMNTEAAEKSEVGVLANLLTTDKTNLVSAINEVRTENRTTPTLVTANSGFASGWTGTIKYWKNLENYTTIVVDLVKDVDISGSETLFTMPVGFRPISDVKHLTNYKTSSLVSVAGSFGDVIVVTTGAIVNLPVTGTPLANAKAISRFTASYYST